MSAGRPQNTVRATDEGLAAVLDRNRQDQDTFLVPRPARDDRQALEMRRCRARPSGGVVSPTRTAVSSAQPGDEAACARASSPGARGSNRCTCRGGPAIRRRAMSLRLPRSPERIADERSDRSADLRSSRPNFSATDGASWHVSTSEVGMTSTASIGPFQHSRGAPLEWIGRVVRDGLRTEISRLTALDGSPPLPDEMDLAHRVGIQAAAIGALLGLPRRARNLLLRCYFAEESASSIAPTYQWNLLRTEAEISEARVRVLAALDAQFGARAAWVSAFPQP